ncbi:MAG: class I SAM-dependent methyltransferase [Lewinella sp.]|nr:class I SAM-dependent methyltransferase [Lewinella sp.]
MKLYQRFFARIYDPFMASSEEGWLRPLRQSLLGGLGGHVLEIGAGTGINFAYYPAGTRVTACDPSGPMLAFARQKAVQSSVKAKIRVLEASADDPCVQANRPAEGWDYIVFTLVLCTVPNPRELLQQCYDWLHPDGRLIVLEHVASDSRWGLHAQKMAQPLWGVFSEGCQLHRPTGAYIKEAGFVPQREERLTKGLPFLLGIYEK